MTPSPPDPAAVANAGQGAITLVTVVHGGEVPLLEMQARSLARHATQAGIAEILVLVNDRDEDGVLAQVSALTPLYGPLADRVRVLGGDETFAPTARPARPLHRVMDFVMRHPRLQLINRGGWRGNDGWRLQQAFKLAAARHAQTSHIVFLDSKNIFTGSLSRDCFIAADGRPRARFQQVSDDVNAVKWMRASLGALGCAAQGMPAEITTYITPYCAETAMLRALLDELESLNGPAAAFFAFRLNNATEFTLINAYCRKQGRDIRTVFAEGLMRSYTIWGNLPLIDAILQEAEENGARCIGLHRHTLGILQAPQRAAVARLLTGGGVISAPSELDDLIARMQSMGARHVA